MTDNEKRELVKYILATPFIKLVEDYKSASKERKQDLIIYCSALLKRIKKLNATPSQIDKIDKFIKFTTGMIRIKPASSDSSENAGQP